MVVNQLKVHPLSSKFLVSDGGVNLHPYTEAAAFFLRHLSEEKDVGDAASDTPPPPVRVHVQRLPAEGPSPEMRRADGYWVRRCKLDPPT